MFKLKRKTHKRFSKIVCTAISVAMILTTLFTFTASATSYSNNNGVTENWIAVDKDSELYQQALSVLGITEEEATEYNIYSVSEDSFSTRGVTVPNNSGFYYFSEFTFYDDNVGSYWTCQGNQLKWGFTWYPTYGTNEGQYLYVELYEYYNTFINDSGCRYCGYNYTSDWISAHQCDYRFKYWTSILTTPYITAYATVQMFVATRTV